MKPLLRNLAFVALLALLPVRAWALCPNCLGQSPSLPSTLRLVGIFLLVPPAVFFGVAMVIRRLLRQSLPPSAGGGDQGG